MKLRNLFITLITLGTMSLSSCDKSFHELVNFGYHTFGSYVQGYYKWDVVSVTMFCEQNELFIYAADKDGVDENMFPPIVAAAYATCCNASFCAPTYNKELDDAFKYYSNKFGDTNYNEERAREGGIVMAICEAFVKIDIVSDADYDSLHPAGTSLSDIVKCEFETYYPFVAGGCYEPNGCGGGDHKTHISKLMCELEPADLTLIAVENVKIGPLMRFDFTSNPSLSQQHKYTLTFTNDEGREFVYSVRVDYSTEEYELEK